MHDAIKTSAKRESVPNDMLVDAPDVASAVAAVYLTEAKGPFGQPLDAVARFHLGNGAELHRINPNADLSSKGLDQSYGVMVNYLYELDKVETRHEAYAAGLELAVSRSVRRTLNRPRPWAKKTKTEGRENADQSHI